MSKLLIIFFWALTSVACYSQEERDSVLTLPPLQLVIDSALKNSPLLKIKDLELQKLKEDLKIEKKKLGDYFFVEGSANYGIYDQLVLSNNAVDGTTYNNLLNQNKMVRYYGGVGVKLPFTAIFSRKNEIAIRKMTLEQMQYEQQQTQDDIRQIIIDEYFKVQYLQQSMQTFQSTYETLKISQMKSEREVISGRMDMNNYALLVSTVGKSKDDYDKAKSSFQSELKKLQILSGLTLK